MATKSGHSRGSTVDISIIRLGQQITDIRLVEYKLGDGRVIQVRDDGSEFMCGHFDLFDESSHHDTPLVSQDCLARRNLLRAVMRANGFRMLQEEWWHYTLEN